MYLLWYDDAAKVRTEAKIAAGIDAYTRRFSSAPNVVLVNRDQVVAVPGVVVRAEGYIRLNNFWIGWEDGAGYRAAAGDD